MSMGEQERTWTIYVDGEYVVIGPRPGFHAIEVCPLERTRVAEEALERCQWELAELRAERTYLAKQIGWEPGHISDPRIGDEHSPADYAITLWIKESKSLQALREGVRELVDALDYEPDEKERGPSDSYGTYACGCTWDSGPYDVPCAAHDGDARVRAAVSKLLANLNPDKEDR